MSLDMCFEKLADMSRYEDNKAKASTKIIAKIKARAMDKTKFEVNPIIVGLFDGR